MPVGVGGWQPTRVLHAPECDACRRPMRFGVEVACDWTCEPELEGLALHVVCWAWLSHGVRAARALEGGLRAACAPRGDSDMAPRPTERGGGASLPLERDSVAARLRERATMNKEAAETIRQLRSGEDDAP